MKVAQRAMQKMHQRSIKDFSLDISLDQKNMVTQPAMAPIMYWTPTINGATRMRFIEFIILLFKLTGPVI